jgi:hypothetical protein
MGKTWSSPMAAAAGAVSTFVWTHAERRRLFFGNLFFLFIYYIYL